MKKRNLITCALPYANGPVHIGHLAGVYVPADIYVRYLRMRGRETLFVCGSDEHGVPITIAARKEGCSPQDIVDKYHNIIKKSFADFGITFDIYSRTTSPTHHRYAAEFFRKLYDEGKFIEKEIPKPRCSWPTATSWAPAPNAAMKALMATSARNAAPPSARRSSSTRIPR